MGNGWNSAGALANAPSISRYQGSGTRRRPDLLSYAIDLIAPCPWPAMAGVTAPMREAPARAPLYTPEQRARRDATRWTLVQGILAPLQFAVFLASLGLVLNYLATGTHYQAAIVSVVVKTLVLYIIMITGSIWEKRVFGAYLFAPAFFWEDAVSMVVIALHTAYLLELGRGGASPAFLMALALAAYAAYAVNAAQFLLKLRAARRSAPAARAPHHAVQPAK